MNIEQQANELVDKFTNIEFCKDFGGMDKQLAKQCAIICCKLIISCNPHSNPFNTDIHSTMDYWKQVKNYIENNL